MSDHSGPGAHPDPKPAFGGASAQDAAPFADAERRKRAQEARAAKIAAGAHFRRDFLDAPHWLELARARGVLLPQWYVAPTPGQMSKWLRKLGVSTKDYLAWSGEHTLAEFARSGPHWPLRAFVGLVLEGLESGALRDARTVPPP